MVFHSVADRTDLWVWRRQNWANEAKHVISVACWLVAESVS